jgi:hypothetical protein
VTNEEAAKAIAEEFSKVARGMESWAEFVRRQQMQMEMERRKRTRNS